MDSVMVRARLMIPKRLFNAVGRDKENSIDHAKALQAVLNGTLTDFDITIKVSTQSVAKERRRSGRV